MSVLLNKPSQLSAATGSAIVTIDIIALESIVNSLSVQERWKDSANWKSVEFIYKNNSDQHYKIVFKINQNKLTYTINFPTTTRDGMFSCVDLNIAGYNSDFLEIDRSQFLSLFGSTSIFDINVIEGYGYVAPPPPPVDFSSLTFTNKTTDSGLGGNYVFDVYVDSSGKIYAATEAGLSISTDGGNSFTNKTTVNGLASNQVRAIFIDSYGKIYAATFGGVGISTDGGNSFINKVIYSGVNDIKDVFVDNSGKIYVAAWFAGMWVSTDEGNTWDNKLTGSGINSVQANAVHVSNSGTIYVGTTADLLISTTGGDPIPGDPTPWFNTVPQSGLNSGWIRHIHIDSSGTVYVGTGSGSQNINDGGLGISTDEPHPFDEGLMFSNKTAVDGLGSGVYIDGSGNFAPATGSSKVSGVYVDNSGYIYAGTDGGLSISTNNGTSFINKTISSGLGSNFVNKVYVDNSGKIYAATHNGLSISN